MIKYWNDIPERLHLINTEGHLWLANLDEEDPNNFLGFLSDDERVRAGRLVDHRKSTRFTIARGILRVLLGHYLSCSPERLVFSNGIHGKPRLSGRFRGKLSFNISHSEDLAIFAIAKGIEVGVDIEKIHSVGNIETTATFFLSPEESDKFKALPGGRKLEQFFTLWTCKEAVLKVLGSGFNTPDNGILATFEQHEQADDRNDNIFKDKRLTIINTPMGFKGALACLSPI
jgi:4'-phosphopantetheinyl transferase